MMGTIPGAPIGRDIKWHTIDWEAARRSVRRLQMRIAKAVTEGRHGKAKALQWLLTHSFHAKVLAVKRVTSSSPVSGDGSGEVKQSGCPTRAA